MKHASLLSVFIIAVVGSTDAGAKVRLKDLVDRADMVYRGQVSAGVFAMKIKTKSYQRSFKIVIWDDSRGEEKTLIKILGPALWRGHGTLKVGNQLKLFNPRTNHVTVVSHSMLGDSWMGSHFSNDDLVKETRLSRHYNQKLISSSPGKNEQGQEVIVHQVALTPKPTAPVTWGKIIYKLWEQGELVLPVSASYFRKAGSKSPERTISFSKVKKMGGRKIPSVMMVTVRKKPGEHTAIEYRTIKFDPEIPASKFTEQALRR